MNKLQNSPYFCVLKYARAVKQKAGARLKTESETGERRCFFFVVFFFARLTRARSCEACALRAHTTLTPRFIDFFTDFEKKTDCFAVQVMNGYYSKTFMS